MFKNKVKCQEIGRYNMKRDAIIAQRNAFLFWANSPF